jgi:Protein of unknown function (DUF3644)
MAAHTKWWHILPASKNEACFAVDVYNRSSGDRNLEAFVVQMHLAWLYLLHARFLRDGVDYRHQHANRHFVRVDGEVKTWELARCVQEEFVDENDPVRRNIEFFIKLRNKVEHRYEKLLADAVAGKVQAHVLNCAKTRYPSKPGRWSRPLSARGQSPCKTRGGTSRRCVPQGPGGARMAVHDLGPHLGVAALRGTPSDGY